MMTAMTLVLAVALASVDGEAYDNDSNGIGGATLSLGLTMTTAMASSVWQLWWVDVSWCLVMTTIVQ